MTREFLKLVEENGPLERIKGLIDQGADIKVTDELGNNVAMLALKNLNIDLVYFFLSQGVDAKARDNSLKNLLHLIASIKVRDFSKKLSLLDLASHLIIQHGLDVSSRDVSDRTPLHDAAESGFYEYVYLLVSQGADVSAKDRSNLTPFDLALKAFRDAIVKVSSDSERIKKLIDLIVQSKFLHAERLFIKLISRTESQEMYEHLFGLFYTLKYLSEEQERSTKNAAFLKLIKELSEKDSLSSKDKKLVERLLKLGANIDARDSDGNTGLHLAVLSGNSSLVNYLLSLGANPNLLNKRKESPLLLAAYDEAITYLLMINGADIMITDSQGRTLLYYALKNSNFELAEELINAGIDINHKDHNGDTVLMSFIHRIDVVKFLLSYGPDLSVRNSNGYTPLLLAIEHGKIDTAIILLENGAEIDERYIIARKKMSEIELLSVTPLELAILNGLYELADLLIKKGADPSKLPRNVFERYVLRHFESMV
ncbi:MAG: ankyrin repeat domain-containing protein [Candidatus Micrarchaeota archaeon]|nr:ankyrin repeat domain-containing protein [Candidatus Micrarchaeota archaeon]